MIVYANRKRRVRTRITETNWRDALIRFGEIEAAIADDLCPERDAPHPLLEQLRAIAIRVASGDVTALKQLPPLPPELCVSIPEGYAYYAVYPEDYAKAAFRFFIETRPQKAVVIGIRSIGTSLSAAVAAALLRQGCKVRSFTIRPRGHPFDRYVSASFPLDLDAHFLVVDEGPGLSGSSFASVASYLSQAGVPDHRIALFPSWDADGQNFVSASARSQWVRHRRYVESRNPPPGCLDLSGGQWRRLSSATPPVQPQHERRKYLRDGCLLKFEGLSDYGRTKRNRAQILWEAGFAPRPLSLDDGYLASEWLEGRPLGAPEPELETWIRRYLGFVQTRFPSDLPVPYEENMKMIRVNVLEGLGDKWAASADRLEPYRAELCDRGTVQIDGRMLPHEWLGTSAGLVKTDALDHHDDHFFPGSQDIAWDVAAASVEFGLTELQGMIPPACSSFYKIAYLSYRLGYCVMAATSGSDFDQFNALADTYRQKLRYELNSLR